MSESDVMRNVSEFLTNGYSKMLCDIDDLKELNKEELIKVSDYLIKELVIANRRKELSDMVNKNNLDAINKKINEIVSIS